MDSIEDEDPEVLRARLHRLKGEHQDLDAVIARLEENPITDAFQVQRLKKRKLALKDEIARIEDALQPDIIA